MTSPHEEANAESPIRSLRREFLKVLAGLGVGTGVFHRALAAQAAQDRQVTAEMIQQAEWIAGLELTEEQREATAKAMNGLQRKLTAIRSTPVAYETPPAVMFHAAPPQAHSTERPRRRARLLESAAKLPDSEEDLAFLPVSELAALVRSRQVSSLELTKLYLKRLAEFDPQLHCVVTLTEDVALKQAKRADTEISAGRYRGPLHGIPWGAKDLIAYPGYKTTWGAKPFQEQQFNYKATVARRLDEAGAVLVAKLTLGALAWGDLWFGGKTRNPWNPREGSSGSSAGSASATAAGLVGFSLGSETLGSIVSPSRRCGATGLRPTFGRVSRHGCMPLAWSMDKIGPICRSVEDCALVFDAIHGWDGLDETAVSAPFTWPAGDIRSLKVGYMKSGPPVEERSELNVLRELGVQLVPIELPRNVPAAALTLILNTEAATVFDELTRTGNIEGLNLWPNVFRQAELTPAVEYLRANRIRTVLKRKMKELMQQVDLYVGGNDLVITNLTGHPSVVMPSALRRRNGALSPGSTTFTGRLFEEEKLLAVAHAFQQATGHHLRHPTLKKDEQETQDQP